MNIQDRLAQYTPVPLTADLGSLTESQRQKIPILVEAAQAMEEIFWLQAYGDREALLTLVEDPDVRRYIKINYGPWDRLRENEPFVKGAESRPPGANFYPPDMTREEFTEAIVAKPELKSQTSIVRRGKDGKLIAIPYYEFFAEQVKVAADRLRDAAMLAQHDGLRRYLSLRAEALLTDDYRPSDLAWMDMKTNTVDMVVGPIETYQDQLFGYKAANEALVLVKDRGWPKRLAQYVDLLPRLQASLPVPAPYRSERPGTGSDLNVYDAIYYAGDANASIPIAVNLPNDVQVQLQKGTRSLQLRNVMQAKFEKVLVPIANVLIANDQLQHVSFDAFFNNVLFHEIAHGLGIKNTIAGKGTVREALKEQHAATEESKADILGLYMLTKLHQWGEPDITDLNDNYVTSLASTLRSIRFGASSAHGRANLMCFNFFQEMDAFLRNADTGRYYIDFDKVQAGINALAERILRFQGDGSYDGVMSFAERYGKMDPDLKRDLRRLGSQGIPIDIVLEQASDHGV